MKLSKTQWLLVSVMAFLVFLRFCWLPVLEWQDQIRADYELQYRKLTKMQSLIDKKGELERKLVDIQEKLATIQGYFPEVKDQAMHRIEIQGRIQSLAEENQLRVTRYNWMDIGGGAEDGIVRDSLEVNLSGDFASFVHFGVQLETVPLMQSVSFFNFNFPNAKAGVPNQIQGSFRVEFFGVSN